MRLIAVLYRGGATPGVPDGIQRIPLHYAVQQRDPDVARLLIVAGEDLYAKDYGGYAPLDLIRGRAVKQDLVALAREVAARGKGQGRSTQSDEGA